MTYLGVALTKSWHFPSPFKICWSFGGWGGLLGTLFDPAVEPTLEDVSDFTFLDDEDFGGGGLFGTLVKDPKSL